MTSDTVFTKIGHFFAVQLVQLYQCVCAVCALYNRERCAGSGEGIARLATYVFFTIGECEWEIKHDFREEK